MCAKPSITGRCGGEGFLVLRSFDPVLSLSEGKTTMGLTIHYGMTSKTRSTARAKALVERMRQLALDLPFERSMTRFGISVPTCASVPLTICVPNETCFLPSWTAASTSPSPGTANSRPASPSSRWKSSRSETIPGPGREWASFGLARYPAEVEVTYCPRSDDRFIQTVKNGGWTWWGFDWKRWERWLERNGHKRWEFPEDEKFQEKRKVKTGLGSDLALLDLLQDAVCQWRASVAGSPTSFAATCASSTCSTGSANCRR